MIGIEIIYFFRGIEIYLFLIFISQNNFSCTVTFRC